MKLVFNEWYGELRQSTLNLVKKYNVSPADFDMLLDDWTDNYGQTDWFGLNNTIRKRSPNGYYQPVLF